MEGLLGQGHRLCLIIGQGHRLGSAVGQYWRMGSQAAQGHGSDFQVIQGQKLCSTAREAYCLVPCQNRSVGWAPGLSGLYD